MARTLFCNNMLTTLFSLFSLLSFALALPTRGPVARAAPALRFPYSSQKVRGVSLGGWLVLEEWMTPSVFEGLDSRVIDEWTFGQYVPKANGTAILKKHWDTFITEAEIKAISAAGLNHVRIPIGYWAFAVGPGEPFYQGQLPYLYKAVSWAQKYGLKVLIDLHGAPGSQNGFPESGQAKPHPEWQSNTTDIARTVAIIKTMSKEFSQSKYASVVSAISPLNEPAGFAGDDVLRATKQYWLDSYTAIRFPQGTSKAQGPLLDVIGDAFQNLTYWNGFMLYPKYEGVMMDVHRYQMFSQADLSTTLDAKIQRACSWGQENLAYTKKNLWVIAGEWTTAYTDCAASKIFNKRGGGSRYDGTMANTTKIGDCSVLSGPSKNYSADYKKFMRKYFEAQTQAFEKGSGWIYWTWKHEIGDDWSYKAGLAGGWIPKKPTDRMYPGICG